MNSSYVTKDNARIIYNALTLERRDYACEIIYDYLLAHTNDYKQPLFMVEEEDVFVVEEEYPTIRRNIFVIEEGYPIIKRDFYLKTRHTRSADLSSIVMIFSCDKCEIVGYGLGPNSRELEPCQNLVSFMENGFIRKLKLHQLI